MSKKKYIVTGGSGFIGSHIVDELIGQHHTVIVVDNNSNNLKPIINQNASYYDIDISDINNIKKLSEIFHECDGIFHCAALINVQDSISRPYKYEINNTLGTLNILQIAAELKVKRVVYSSSAAVYGNTNDIPISESNMIDPISPYGAQKYYGEVMCKMFSELYGLETCCLRYFNAFGERQKISGSYATVVGIFKYQILQNLPMTITGDGKQRRDFIYVKDLAKANIMAMTNKNKFLGETINLGSGENFSINQIAEFFGGSKKYISAVKEPKESLANINKANEALGWNPTTNIERWIKNNL